MDHSSIQRCFSILGRIQDTRALPQSITISDAFLGELDWLVELVAHYRMSLRAQRNSLVAANKLPAEVLLRIFGLVGPTSRSAFEDPPPTLVAFSQVCRPWRHVALSSPTLWSTLVLEWSDSALAETRERARDMPLDVTAELGGQVSRRVETLLQQGAPVNILRLMASSRTLRDFFTTVDAPALRLHSLLLSRIHPRVEDIGGDLGIRNHLLKGCTPDLKILHMYECMLDWKDPVFSILTELKISFEEHFDCVLFLEDILETLEHCPMLERLDLVDVADIRPSFLDQFSQATLRSVNLAKLKSFRLQDDLSCMVYILTYVRVPTEALLSLHASWDMKRAPTKDQLQQLFNYLASCPHLASESRPYSFSFTGDTNHIDMRVKTAEGQKSQLVFQMMLDEDKPYPIFPTRAWLFHLASRTLPLSNLRELYLGGMTYKHQFQGEQPDEEEMFDRLVPNDLLWFLKRLNSVETLRIAYGAVGPCFAVLCTPESSDMLPKLKNMIIRHSDLSMRFKPIRDLPHLGASHEWPHGFPNCLDLIKLFVDVRRQISDVPTVKVVLAACRFTMDSKIDEELLMIPEVFGDEADRIVIGTADPYNGVDAYDSDGCNEEMLEL